MLALRCISATTPSLQPLLYSLLCQAHHNQEDSAESSPTSIKLTCNTDTFPILRGYAWLMVRSNNQPSPAGFGSSADQDDARISATFEWPPAYRWAFRVQPSCILRGTDFCQSSNPTSKAAAISPSNCFSSLSEGWRFAA